MRRVVIWTGADAWRSEVAEVELLDGGLRATGTQVAPEPFPYRLDYRLDATDEFRTRSLEVAVRGADFERSVRLDDPGDCDLGLSPLTNSMPVLRHRLHERPGSADFVMQWVSVPDLAVHVSPQRYEHVRPGVVRFVDLGLHDGFTAELALDEDGLVLDYPDLARRV